VDKNTEQNGHIVTLLRALTDDFKGSSKKTDAEMKTCFELATRVDIDHQRRLEYYQNRDLQRNAELREEFHALQAVVSNLVTHVKGLTPLKPAVSEQAGVPALPQEPVDEVSPEMKKLARAYVGARRRIRMQRNFSEWRKFAGSKEAAGWSATGGTGLSLRGLKVCLQNGDLSKCRQTIGALF
jgi:hypothetical protein